MYKNFYINIGIYIGTNCLFYFFPDEDFDEQCASIICVEYLKKVTNIPVKCGQ